MKGKQPDQVDDAAIGRRAFSDHVILRRQQAATGRTGSGYDGRELEALAHRFAPFFTTGRRIQVEGPSGIRTGLVSIGAGFRPRWILLHRAGALRSDDILGPDDRVIGVQTANNNRRGYFPIPGLTDERTSAS